jgi:hypothetical protein
MLSLKVCIGNVTRTRQTAAKTEVETAYDLLSAMMGRRALERSRPFTLGDRNAWTSS